MKHITDFRDQLVDAVITLDGVYSAGVVGETDKAVIGVELTSGDELFIEIQPV